MEDISSERNSQGFSILRHQVQKLGREAYEKYGCNLVAILMDEPESNCAGGLSKPSMIYKTPGASRSFDSHFRSDYMNVLTEHLVTHEHGYSEHEHRASRGKALRRAEGNLSTVTDQDIAHGDSDDSNQWSDPDDDDFSEPSRSPRNRPPIRSGFRFRRPYFMNVKKAIVNEANQAGVDIHWRVLPWKTLPDICAKSGVYINNYPDGLVSPFKSRYTGARDIGISELSDDEHKMLIHALRDEKMHPMRFLRAENAHDIMNNEFPVLIYAPPPPDSSHTRSKRIFLDGTYDYEGYHQVGGVRDLNNERQKKRPGRPRKYPYKNVQELKTLDFVQHSVSKRRLNEAFVNRPEKRNRLVGT